MSRDPLASLQSEVKQESFYADGINQFTAGLIITIVALKIRAGILIPIWPLVFLLPLFTERMRRRFTYPRIGFTKPLNREIKLWKAILLIIAALVVGSVVVMLAVTDKLSGLVQDNIDLLIAIVGWGCFSVIMLYRWFREKHLIFLFYGFSFALIAIFVWVFKLHSRQFALFMLGFGVINLVLGSLTFLSFIKKYPVLQDEN